VDQPVLRAVSRGDPWGLAGLRRYVLLMLVVSAVTVGIACGRVAGLGVLLQPLARAAAVEAGYAITGGAMRSSARGADHAERGATPARRGRATHARIARGAAEQHPDFVPRRAA